MSAKEVKITVEIETAAGIRGWKRKVTIDGRRNLLGKVVADEKIKRFFSHLSQSLRIGWLHKGWNSLECIYCGRERTYRIRDWSPKDNPCECLSELYDNTQDNGNPLESGGVPPNRENV